MTQSKNKRTKLASGIYRRSSGEIEIRITHRDPRSTKRADVERILPAGTPLEEAIKQRALLLQKLQQGQSVVPPAAQTLSDFARHWVGQRALEVAPSTLHSELAYLDNHILPALGHFYLTALLPTDLVAWRSKLEQSELTLRTTRNAWSVAVMLLRAAWRDLALPGSPPSKDQRSPRRTAKPIEDGGRETRTLTMVEVGQMLEQVRAIGPQRHAEAAVMAWTGLRSGEVYGLHVEDVDLERGILSVRRAVWRGVSKSPKTKRGLRQVPILEPLAEVLRAWLAQGREAALAEMGAEAKLARAKVLFPSQEGAGSPYRYDNSLRKMKPTPGGVRATAQMLRRTVNSRLVEQVALSAGSPEAALLLLQDAIGHTSSQMTLHYLKANPEAKRRLWELLLQAESGTDKGGERPPGGGLKWE
jgi:integrase